MNLYLVHCGYYDNDICDGLYESHANFFVPAKSFDDAREKLKLVSDFQTKRMHIDGLQEIQVIGGFRVRLEQDTELGEENRLINFKYRALGPKS